MKKLCLVIAIISLPVVFGGSQLLPVDIGIKSGMSIVNVSLSKDVPSTEFNFRLTKKKGDK